MSNTNNTTPQRQTRPRRSNQERTEITASALLAAARELFVTKGYADTATPEIVAAANLTRGALYHHFEDKTDLFRAVVMKEAQAVADSIGSDTARPRSPIDALMAGADAWFEAMSVPGRARLLLIDGPSVLGHAEMSHIDNQTGGRTLRDGLAAALGPAASKKLPVDALAAILSADFDRAALAVNAGEPLQDYRKALKVILERLVAPAR